MRVAYQLNSRKSMIPSVPRTKLKYYGNYFEDIKLSEEDEKILISHLGYILQNKLIRKKIIK